MHEFGQPLEATAKTALLSSGNQMEIFFNIFVQTNLNVHSVHFFLYHKERAAKVGWPSKTHSEI